MKERLYSIMEELDAVTEQLEDMKIALKIQVDGLGEENQHEAVKSVFRVQIRLLEQALRDNESVYRRMDEMALKMARER